MTSPGSGCGSDGTRRSQLVRADSEDISFDAEVIGDLEHAGYAIGHHAGKVLIRFPGNDTHECHIPILPLYAIFSACDKGQSVNFGANPLPGWYFAPEPRC